MAFKCDQKSSCDVWWRSFDLNMGCYYHTTTMCRQQLLLWLLSTQRTVHTATVANLAKICLARFQKIAPQAKLGHPSSIYMNYQPLGNGLSFL